MEHDYVSVPPFDGVCSYKGCDGRMSRMSGCCRECYREYQPNVLQRVRELEEKLEKLITDIAYDREVKP